MFFENSKSKIPSPELCDSWHILENLVIDGYIAHFGSRIMTPRDAFRPPGNHFIRMQSEVIISHG